MRIEISVHAIPDFFLQIQSKLHSAAANGSWVGVWLREKTWQAQKNVWWHWSVASKYMEIQRVAGGCHGSKGKRKPALAKICSFLRVWEKGILELGATSRPSAEGNMVNLMHSHKVIFGFSSDTPRSCKPSVIYTQAEIAEHTEN